MGFSVRDKLYKETNYAVRAVGTVSQNAQGLYSVSEDLRVTKPFGSVQFSRVGGSVQATGAGLRSLKGMPFTVGGNCLVGDNLLETLEGAPKKVDVFFSCRNNQLQSLVGTPECGSLNVSGNPLRNLEGMPTGLEYLTAVDIEFESLQGFQPVSAKVIIEYQKTLGLLKLLTASEINLFSKHQDQAADAAAVEEIMNRYAGQGRNGSLACGAELARAGFKENARW